MKKKLLKLGGFILILAFLAFYFFAYLKFPIANGYAAKVMCTCTFVQHRSQDSIQNEDLYLSPLNLTSSEIDTEHKSVTTSIFGLAARTAVYRDRLGCILLKGNDDFKMFMKKDAKTNVRFPFTHNTTVGLDQGILSNAVKFAFDTDSTKDEKMTRALMIIHRDTVICEKYSSGINEHTPLLGWSMTKSVMNALVGLMIKNGRMNLSDVNLLPNWTDSRKEINLDDLLQMSSGLDWVEDYQDLSPATKMLFMSEDIVSSASDKKCIRHDKGKWEYSSGTTNILSGILRSKFKSIEEYHRFPYDSLFYPIGMNSAFIETDESGNFIASSYMYATLRDWARFGMLYLHNGNWQGKQLLPESWISYSRTPNEQSGGIYGAHFWQNKKHIAYKNAPEDLYSADGYQGQEIFIIPSKDLVIVRLGLKDMDFDQLLSMILDAIE